ncbi:hypothetical protein [Streptomyces sp. CAU 1734]|uniref:hypothetical protein n=1 Tax=Streptomyces sp. CAU 1734 TaxID=3140360 RepID=UPI003260C095
MIYKLTAVELTVVPTRIASELKGPLSVLDGTAPGWSPRLPGLRRAHTGRGSQTEGSS